MFPFDDVIMMAARQHVPFIESYVSYMIVFYVFETKTVYVEIVFLMHGEPWSAVGYVYRLILVLSPANERRRYKVTPSLIGWAQPKNQPCCIIFEVTHMWRAVAGVSV